MIFKCSERGLVSPRVFFFPAPVLAPRGVSACHRPLLQVPSDKPETRLFQDELELEAGEEAPCWSFGGKAGLTYPSEVGQWMEFPLDTAWGKLVLSVALPLLLMCGWKKWPKGRTWESVLGWGHISASLCGAQP